MSGFTGQTDGGPQAELGWGPSGLSSDLMALLQANEIQPGSPPSYELCKLIYTSHPLGAKMAEAPLNMAQSQPRDITVPGAPEERLIEAYQREWKALGCDAIIHNAMKVARIYGISSLVIGARGTAPDQPLPMDRLHALDLYFNVLDPLNTAGSLVLDQDPNAADYQKPRALRVADKIYHPSRTVITLNEAPIYIDWTNSAFGFVGRSVYQRALYPLKSFVQTMITDDLVSYKAGVIVAKMKSPSSNTTNRMMSFFGWKRGQVKTATTGQVMGISPDEAIESIDLKNLEGPFNLARNNILKNIATAASMPAKMLDQETLVEGFGEGSEDAKQIARYIDRVRIEMAPLYAVFDNIVQRRAWSPDFYDDLKRDLPREVPNTYEAAFYQWRNAFRATWPNLLTEPESERIKVEDVRFKAVVALIEVMLPAMDPENRKQVLLWAADECNTRKDLFASKLLLDPDELDNWQPPQVIEPKEEPFSERS